MNLTMLGIRLDVTGEPGWTARLAAALDRLWADVPGEVNVDDAHPRFDEHVVLITAATNEWPDLEFALDEAGRDPAKMNALEREAIRRIKAELAKITEPV